MNSVRLVLQDHFQIVDGALSFHDMNAGIRSIKSLSNLFELFQVVQSRNQFVFRLSVFGHLVGHDERARKEESEMQFL